VGGGVGGGGGGGGGDTGIKMLCSSLLYTPVFDSP
jgi:hypothetical protein